MKPIIRILVTLFVSLLTFYLSYWVALALLGIRVPNWALLLIAAACAVGAGRLFWVGPQSKGGGNVLRTMLLWAVVIGCLGFLGGFIGPMIFTPDANQGPLLGILITGPLGFVLGGVAGLIYALRQRHRNDGS